MLATPVPPLTRTWRSQGREDRASSSIGGGSHPHPTLPRREVAGEKGALVRLLIGLTARTTRTTGRAARHLAAEQRVGRCDRRRWSATAASASPRPPIPSRCAPVTVLPAITAVTVAGERRVPGDRPRLSRSWGVDLDRPADAARARDQGCGAQQGGHRRSSQLRDGRGASTRGRPSIVLGPRVARDYAGGAPAVPEVSPCSVLGVWGRCLAQQSGVRSDLSIGAAARAQIGPGDKTPVAVQLYGLWPAPRCSNGTWNSPVHVSIRLPLVP